jgi:hypothetical protein
MENFSDASEKAIMPELEEKAKEAASEFGEAIGGVLELLAAFLVLSGCWKYNSVWKR